MSRSKGQNLLFTRAISLYPIGMQRMPKCSYFNAQSCDMRRYALYRVPVLVIKWITMISAPQTHTPQDLSSMILWLCNTIIRRKYEAKYIGVGPNTSITTGDSHKPHPYFRSVLRIQCQHYALIKTVIVANVSLPAYGQPRHVNIFIVNNHSIFLRCVIIFCFCCITSLYYGFA